MSEPIDRRMLDVSAPPNPQPVDAERVVQRALSTSFIAALPDDEQAAVAEQIRQILEGMGERFDYLYRSELQAWVLSP